MSVPKPSSISESASLAADVILSKFDEYQRRFTEITRRARQRFENRDWPGIRADSVERMDLYELVLTETAGELQQHIGSRIQDRGLWFEIKSAFLPLLAGRHDADVAATFFNSVTRKVLLTVGIDREIEYFRLAASPTTVSDVSVITTRYPAGRPTADVVREILRGLNFDTEYENLERDVDSVSREIDLHLWPIVGYDGFEGIEMIRSPFFRNKVAYLVGRVCISGADACHW